MTEAETFQRVRTAVARLPSRYREVVVLRYLEELPIDQVAAVLRITTNVVHVRLNRARQRLNGTLADLIEE